MRFCILASGSKGNAVWVEASGAAVLVDNGLSGKEFKRRAAQAGLDLKLLRAIVVSHEHRDHVHGVGILARMLSLPVYINEATLNRTRKLLGKIQPRPIEPGRDFTVGHLRLHPFSTSHDAVDPVGFTFEAEGRRLGLATDLGVSTALVREHLKTCQALILEANHDPQMLIDGPYPWELKQRVRGRTGHLSNHDAAELLAEIAHPSLNQVVLAHLSETNNLPHLALKTVGSAFSQPDFTLVVAGQHEPGPVLKL